MRPPLFPLFDNDTDDDNDDCAGNSGGGSSSGGGNSGGGGGGGGGGGSGVNGGGSGDGDRHNPLVRSTKITEQTTATDLRLYFQLALVRMRQVNPFTLHLPIHITLNLSRRNVTFANLTYLSIT